MQQNPALVKSSLMQSASQPVFRDKMFSPTSDEFINEHKQNNPALYTMSQNGGRESQKDAMTSVPTKNDSQEERKYLLNQRFSMG